MAIAIQHTAKTTTRLPELSAKIYRKENCSQLGFPKTKSTPMVNPPLADLGLLHIADGLNEGN